ncbi:hypothetical protein AMTRI_Chr13g116450 [Amborella trichopoda]
MEMEAPFLYGLPSPDFFHIDDLLDFSNDQFSGEQTVGNFEMVSSSSPSMAMAESARNNSNGSWEDGESCPTLTPEICVPSEDLAELEWLSTFVEESFSLPSLPESSDPLAGKPNSRPEPSLPSRARSKRSRIASTWASRIMTVSSPSPDSEFPVSLKSVTGTKPSKRTSFSGEFSGRKCTHCLTEKTPQWRCGPMGPKTLCNACGVRYKSGRLVPEYRPAASPTFVLTQHSNSHRKVMELRRQKELREGEMFIHERQDFKVF